MKKKGILGLVLVVCLLLALASPALAGGLTVSGGKIEASVEPGSDYSYSIKVKNTSGGPMDIAVEVKGYGMSAEKDIKVLEPGEDRSPYTARGLLAVSPTSFHLEPGDTQAIEVTAKIPSGIGDGGRYAIIFIHTAPQGEMVATVTAFAARVLFTVSDSNLTTDSQITEVRLAESGGPAGVLVTVKNKGNYHYKPQIHAELSNGDKVVATVSWSSNWPILPGYSRQFKIDFVGEESLSAGKLDIELTDDSGKLLASGAYLIKLSEEQEVLSPEQTTTEETPVIVAEESPEQAPTGESPASEQPSPTPSSSFPVLPVAGIAAGTIIIITLIVVIVRRYQY